MITVGVNIKNRCKLDFPAGWGKPVSRRPFPAMLKSLANQTCKDFRLIVLDWDSDDDDVCSVVRGFNFPQAKIFSQTGRFSRSEGKNMLIDNCETSHLFLIDADMILPRGLIAEAYRHIDAGVTFWFPECRYEADPTGRIISGYVPNAVGNVLGEIGAFRSLMFKTGGCYSRWGNEDVNFFERAKINPLYNVLRTRTKMVHQYHTDKERRQYDEPAPEL